MELFAALVPAVYWSSLLTVFYSLRCASPLFMFRTSPLSTNNIHTEIISIAVNRITSKLQPPSLPCKHNLQCLNLNKGSKWNYLNHKIKEIANIHKNLARQRLLFILYSGYSYMVDMIQSMVTFTLLYSMSVVWKDQVGRWGVVWGIKVSTKFKKKHKILAAYFSLQWWRNLLCRHG